MPLSKALPVVLNDLLASLEVLLTVPCVPLWAPALPSNTVVIIILSYLLVLYDFLDFPIPSLDRFRVRVIGVYNVIRVLFYNVFPESDNTYNAY